MRQADKSETFAFAITADGKRAFFRGQKQSEITQDIGISENIVKTNLSRVKAKIKNGALDNVSIIEIGPTVHTFPYLFIVTRNEDSVFGYQVVSMSYGMR